MQKKTKAHAVPSGQHGPEIGGLVLTKVVREHIPLFGGGSGTFGQAVDDALRMAAQNGEMVQSFEVHINEDHWQDFARSQPVEGWEPERY